MKLVKIVLPVGLLALASVAANAQSIPALPDLDSENPGDLVLGFSSSAVSKDLLFDVGPASDYYTAQTAATLGATGFTAPLTGGMTYTVVAYSPTDLATEFGSSASSSTTYWTVVGGNGSDGGPLGTTPNSNLWVSAPSTTTVLSETALNQGGLSNKIDVGLTNAMFGGGNAAAPGSFASNDAYVPGTKVFSQDLTGGNNFNYYSGSVVGNTGSSSSSINLYELQPTSSGTAPGVELGTFTLTSSGLTFTAIPEPSTYAAVLGVLTLGFVLLRRRSKAATLNAIG